MRLWILLAFTLALAGCIVTGPATEKKHPLDVLNGENYDVGPAGPDRALMIPIVKAKERESRIEGRVQIDNGLVPIPMRFIAVELVDRTGKNLAHTTTGDDGSFVLSAVLPNGLYQVRLHSDHYTASQFVEIKDYLTQGIQLLAVTK